MSFKKKNKEIKRLIKAFEIEADKFQTLKFSTYSIKQSSFENKKFLNPNHVIMLWQYYGITDGKDFVENFKESDLKWGIRGAEVSFFGVIEGETTRKFINMAQRAGSLFNKKEIDEILDKTLWNYINQNTSNRNQDLKPIGISNNNTISIWLNYLLYYLSIISQEDQKTTLNQVDPYALSLFALEQLQTKKSILTVDRSVTKLENIKFDVAFSFPGEKRKFVSKVADIVRKKLKRDKLFYDFDYQSQLAKPNIDILLQKIYHKNSKLIVVFLSSEYSEKEWCGLEWRAIRDIIKLKNDRKIMFIKFDKEEIDGLFSIDGYIDATFHSEKKVAQFILERINLLNS